MAQEMVITKEIIITEETKPKPPLAAIVYGEIIYWGTLLGAIIATIGTAFAFIAGKNYRDIPQVFSLAWQGNNIATIWNEVIGKLPQGHWYLTKLSSGDGLTMFGIAFGVFAVIPAMFFSGLALLKQKEYLFSALAFIAGLICIVAFLGLIALPS
ncbi:MAG: DUF1634 domain-containing protein [Candidatus Desulfofervidus auxilii]|nr:DUF1634 domain-containing protein [Candidatus Desulfofervidus auxilii]